MAVEEMQPVVEEPVEEEKGGGVIPQVRGFSMTKEHGQSVPQGLQQRKQVSKEDWDKMFNQGKFKKEEMDSLVMDFLINHELADVTETFHTESGCEPGIDLQQLRSQKIIRELISSHQIDEAINLINETFGSSFLDDRPRLHFHLEQQKMIELCRSENFEAVLSFSKQFIWWKNFKDGNFDYRKECCKTLLVMAFGDDHESTVAGLMGTKRLVTLGLFVVEEIVNFQGRGLYSQLPYSDLMQGRSTRSSFVERAVKMLKDKEAELRKEVNFPHFNLNSCYPEHFSPDTGLH